MEPFVIDPHTALGPARLVVADMGRALSFYEGVLGMQVERRADGSVGLKAGETTLLVLDERPGARPKPPRSTGLYHIALLLPSRRDLARVIRRFAETRYPLSGASDHLVSETLYLDDPDGNGLEIYADRPRSTWSYNQREVLMATNPLDIDGILGELQGDTAPWAGMADGSTVGHVHLQVKDLPSAEAFYCGVLGFEVMARYGPAAMFVSAGGYHHHLGLNTWAGVGAPPPPTGAAGLRHFTVRLPGSEALDVVLSRVREAGIAAEDAEGGVLLRDPSQNGVRITA
ncbi:VOC family protein [Chloroflexales bacterium ZM16-3]|nr:VOC family protein [Chloroflexales bacterium ZM16-3]